MDEIQRAVQQFRTRMPNATLQQAEEAADIEFAEDTDQQAFLDAWRFLRDHDAKAKRAEFTSMVDRIWPEDKYP